MPHRDVDEETGLTIRTRNALIRADFGGGEMGDLFHRGPSLNRTKVAAALEDGSILKARLIGKKSIEEIHEWLVRSKPQPNNEIGGLMNLLPCPFCGSANVRAGIDFELDCMAVWCDDCGADGPQLARVDALAWSHNSDENRAKAIRLWNTRAVTLTAIQEG